MAIFRKPSSSGTSRKPRVFETRLMEDRSRGRSKSDEGRDSDAAPANGLFLAIPAKGLSFCGLRRSQNVLMTAVSASPSVSPSCDGDSARHTSPRRRIEPTDHDAISIIWRFGGDTPLAADRRTPDASVRVNPQESHEIGGLRSQPLRGMPAPKRSIGPSQIGSGPSGISRQHDRNTPRVHKLPASTRGTRPQLLSAH